MIKRYENDKLIKLYRESNITYRYSCSFTNESKIMFQDCPILTIILILIIILLFIIYYFLTCRFNYWKDKSIEYIQPYPLFGSIASILLYRKHILNYFFDIYKTFKGKPYVGLFLGRDPALLVLEPEIVKNILIKDFQHFVDHGFLMDEKVDPLDARNLFLLEGHRWKEMRAKLAAIFTSGRLKEMFPVVLNVAQDLENHLESYIMRGNARFEAKDLFSRYTIDVIGSVVFGIECNGLQSPKCEFHNMAKKFVLPTFARATKLLLIIFLPKVTHMLSLGLIDNETTEYFRNLVKKVMEHRILNGETRNDLMQLLIELKETGKIAPDSNDVRPMSNPENGELYANFPSDENLPKWSYDDVTAQALIMLFFGFEVTSSVISFSLLELSLNREIQIKAQLEIDEVLLRHNNMITYQALQEMHYIDCILKETMRKYPPVSITQRTCCRNYIIPNTKFALEKDTMVIIPIHAIQNDPEYFPNPDRFDPDRFSQPYNRNKFVYLPFGDGPRMCLGDRFANMITKLGLITCLRKFNLKLNSKTEYPVKYEEIQYFLNAKGGIWIDIERRDTFSIE